MSMQMRQLLGNPDSLTSEKRSPFELKVVDFLDAVSEDIMKNPQSQAVPGLRAFGFWCRRRHLLQLKAKHHVSDERCGKGKIFHICASNIPGLFAWSMAIGLLMGNSNLVRVSYGKENMDTVMAFCAAFARVMQEKRYSDLSERIAVVTYPKEDAERTIRYSEQSDIRMIWGGDAAIEAVVGLKCEPMPEDIFFPDRTSAAFIDACTVNGLSREELDFKIQLFYNDTYAMDQNACSSPQLIVWKGTENECRQASARWWQAVSDQLKQYDISEKQIYDKYCLMCEISMRPECESADWVNQKLCHIWLNRLPENWSDFRGNSGFFLEYRIDKDEDIRIIDDEKLQTLLVLGADREKLQKIVASQQMKGISRVVSFGEALEMDLVWDGQDLMQRLTEPDFFQWQPQFDEHVMLIDDRNCQMTYRDARIFGEEYFKNMTAHALTLIVTENTAASVLIYIQALRNQLVPILLDKKTDKEQLAAIIEKYRPEYTALPASFGWHSGERYREKWQSKGYILYERDGVEDDEEIPLHKDLALLLSTSGSTGSPKFVKISRENLQANTASIAAYLNITASDRPITTLPMSYTYGLSIINSHLYRGATLLLTEYSVMEQKFWDFFKLHKATTFGGVPYTYKMLQFIGFQDMVLPSLKVMTQAGGKLPIALQKFFTEYGKMNHCPLIVMYGQTEATARMAYLPWKDADKKQGSIGIAIPGGYFWLEDAKGNIIQDSYKTGELIYWGKNVTMGYAVNRQSLTAGDERHGRLATGDLAYRDEDGYYYISGRKKRFLKLLGNRISLDETESLLVQAFPKLEFACIGTDEQMTVFYSGETGDEKRIGQFLSRKLKLFKKNFAVCKIDVIPRNSSGKILYEQLQKR